MAENAIAEKIKKWKDKQANVGCTIYDIETNTTFDTLCGGNGIGEFDLIKNTKVKVDNVKSRWQNGLQRYEELKKCIDAVEKQATNGVLNSQWEPPLVSLYQEISNSLSAAKGLITDYVRQLEKKSGYFTKISAIASMIDSIDGCRADLKVNLQPFREQLVLVERETQADILTELTANQIQHLDAIEKQIRSLILQDSLQQAHLTNLMNEAEDRFRVLQERQTECQTLYEKRLHLVDTFDIPRTPPTFQNLQELEDWLRLLQNLLANGRFHTLQIALEQWNLYFSKHTANLSNHKEQVESILSEYDSFKSSIDVIEHEYQSLLNADKNLSKVNQARLRRAKVLLSLRPVPLPELSKLVSMLFPSLE